ncbi:thioredoxin family protein [Ehrlichia ruminantium]|nr:hypothetical protein FDZ65_00615 [Ehrlichia ruminantium]QLK52943.1 hypothetical protein FDZ64_00605 [Ehrlichia ruminantium]QLK53865.1 hypothetical protein FDZ63_00610 [Ehrlichia ruminantium]QLK56616.1 hypothetical protein FDZ60_00610 [Ehrlichia ruminantium]QLK57528.1 hypothetical protein FDZ59_00600 [Ehrlichia ruminantium]
MNNKHFIFFICIICISIMFFVNKISSYNQEDYSTSNIQLKIHEISSDNILSDIFNTTESKISIVAIYTSWCSSCVKKIPEINKIIANNKDINPIIISLDENKNKLLSFLARQGTIHFTPYNIHPRHMAKLILQLSKQGINFNNNIPYIAVLYKDVRIMNIKNTNQLKSIIQEIREKYNVD